MKISLKDHQIISLAKKLLAYALYVILLIALIRFCLYSSPPLSRSPAEEFRSRGLVNISSSVVSSSLPLKDEGTTYPTKEPSCDYTNGEWIPSKLGPLYNGSSCGTIKDGQNCMSHGRPDIDYLYWRWKPQQCNLPRFEPERFFNLMRNKHLAVVGDSMARNQLESLLCMLASSSPPNLVYNNGDDNKFRRWHFPSFNVTISIYWSPFLVRGIEKSSSDPYNRLFLDAVDERWASDLDGIDVVVLSIGHWYLLSNVYIEGDVILGCHYCGSLNHTEIGFYDGLKKAYRTALKAVSERKGSSKTTIGGGIDVIVTTFSPHHFEGEWDKAGACPKTKPYGEGEKVLEGMDEKMREIGVEQVEEAKSRIGSENLGRVVRMEALDITKLALLRPDGHPGPYMYPFPIANGYQERVQNDCVHWCLPGAIDTWNEIMLEVMKRWHGP